MYVAGTIAKMYVMEFILISTPQNPQLKPDFFNKEFVNFPCLELHNCSIF